MEAKGAWLVVVALMAVVAVFGVRAGRPVGQGSQRFVLTSPALLEVAEAAEPYAPATVPSAPWAA